MKYNGTLSKQQINQYTLIDYALMDRYTYYPSPLLVFGSNGYSKHYFIEGQRVMSRIGDIWDAEAALIPLDTTPDGVDLNNKADQIEAQLETHLVCLALAGEVDYHVDLEWLGWETEPMVFFYHPDHLGSSSFITGATGEPTQHLEYLPFGELFIEERSTWNTPYKFSGKELDDETGYSYFGARYYDPNISIWLSVDPLSDKNFGVSPYAYCNLNPVGVIDPDGRDDYELNKKTGNVTHSGETQHYQTKDGSIISVKKGEEYTGEHKLSELKQVDKVTNSKGDDQYVTKGVFDRKQAYSDAQMFMFGDSKEAESFYMFAASSVDVEYAFAEIQSGGGVVGHDSKSGYTRMTGVFEKEFGSIISRMSHSHPGSGGPPSYDLRTSTGKVGDLNSAAASSHSFIREVYDVPNRQIYQYDGGTLTKARGGLSPWESIRRAR